MDIFDKPHTNKKLKILTIQELFNTNYIATVTLSTKPTWLVHIIL